eukprot:gnl/TRDRNA2_/TRDRNA2_167193_c3_seq1.p1 gnl/TRDRNA2_/TRDRNA2_167193_c3~~gnl/TRDRNA2_/TRDRNA2_167193_c3_seq1.p1  ORF type:complete len:288 (-),score=61.40 gnl/TRDRNA2_/TRDRNA2_167193_c3_seq1:152-988(-)
MNAANFTTFSLGMGVYDSSKDMKWLHDYPTEYYKAEAAGLLQELPRHPQNQELDIPAYVVDVKFTMQVGICISQWIPKRNYLNPSDTIYKHMLYHKIHPTDKFLKYCNDEWDEYQKKMIDRGQAVHDYIPYPYTREVVQGFYDKYNERVCQPQGFSVSIDGPDEAGYKQQRAADKDSIQNGMTELTRSLVGTDMFKKLDPFAQLEARKALYIREVLTASGEGSTFLFDKDKYELWSEWTTGDCKVEDIEAEHWTINTHPEMVTRMYDFLKERKAPPPK